MATNSSTSNSKNRIRPLRETLVVILILLLLELGVRSLTRFEGFPAPTPQWHDARYQTVLEEMAIVKPEVMIIGNSVGKRGINPLIFDQHYQQQTGQPVTSYNASLSGVPAVSVTAFTRLFLIPDYQPETIIWLIRPVDLEPLTNTGIYKWRSAWDSFLSAPTVEARTKPWYLRRSWVTQHWWTWRLRNNLLFVIQNFLRPPAPDDINAPDILGFRDDETIVDIEQLRRTVLNLGAFTSTIDTTLVEELTLFLDTTVATDTEVIIVVVPTLYHEQPNGVAYQAIEDAILQDLQGIISDYPNVSLYDERGLSLDGSLTAEYFYDDDHLNTSGAEIFTKRVAEIYRNEQ